MDDRNEQTAFKKDTIEEISSSTVTEIVEKPFETA